MEYDKIKKAWFIFFAIIVFLLFVIATLWIWEVLSEDVAWKGIFTLLVLTLSTLVVIVTWERLFSKKLK